MGFTLTVRNVDPEDKSWLQRQARQVGVSMSAKRGTRPLLGFSTRTLSRR